MHIILNEIDFQAQLEEDVPMKGPSGRAVIYNPGFLNTDPEHATITRYHSGEWRPGVRQQIWGNPYFANWEATIGSAHGPRLPVRDYTRWAQTNGGKPIRIWDMYNEAPWSFAPITYVPNPIQQTPNSLLANTQTVQSAGQVWRSW